MILYTFVTLPLTSAVFFVFPWPKYIIFDLCREIQSITRVLGMPSVLFAEKREFGVYIKDLVRQCWYALFAYPCSSE